MARGKEKLTVSKGKLNLIEACEKSEEIISHAQEMDKLYRRAVQCFGEGELRGRILDLATQAVEDRSLGEELFVSPENMLSFFCGIWIQFLLIEIGGMKKEKLRSMAQKVFLEFQHEKKFH
jgi:hypothetical protein